MAVSCHTAYMLRSSHGKSTSRFQQVLYDNGILLGLHYGILDLCLYLHNGEVYTDRDRGSSFLNYGPLSQPAFLYPHRLARLHLSTLVYHFILIL